MLYSYNKSHCQTIWDILIFNLKFSVHLLISLTFPLQKKLKFYSRAIQFPFTFIIRLLSHKWTALVRTHKSILYLANDQLPPATLTFIITRFWRTRWTTVTTAVAIRWCAAAITQPPWSITIIFLLLICECNKHNLVCNIFSAIIVESWNEVAIYIYI